MYSWWSVFYKYLSSVITIKLPVIYSFGRLKGTWICMNYFYKWKKNCFGLWVCYIFVVFKIYLLSSSPWARQRMKCILTQGQFIFDSSSLPRISRFFSNLSLYPCKKDGIKKKIACAFSLTVLVLLSFFQHYLYLTREWKTYRTIN